MSSREPRITTQNVQVRAGGATLLGILRLPVRPNGIVVFAHGSGSSRLSPRNQYVAQQLNTAGFATLLLDLLTEEEEDVDLRNGQLRFDIRLLAERLAGATDWLHEIAETRDLPIGYFGASTGAAAALVAAARRPASVGALVSRGGRPDLAADALPLVQAPTLLIIGGFDFTVLQLNQDALRRLRCQKALIVVPGATHLFEEHGALHQVAGHAAAWFAKYLTGVGSASANAG